MEAELFMLLIALAVLILAGILVPVVLSTSVYEYSFLQDAVRRAEHHLRDH